MIKTTGHPRKNFHKIIPAADAPVSGLSEEKILVAGFGGQGIMLLGKIIAEAAIREGKNITYIKSYGAEMRGGTAHCLIKISTKEIASPVFIFPTIAVIMNQPSLVKFSGNFSRDTFVLVNSSLAKCQSRDKFISCSYTFNKEAIYLGSIKVTNIVALGALLNKSKVVRKQSVVAALKHKFSCRPATLDLNLKALERGWKII